MEIMLFIVLALFVLSGIDAWLYPPKRAAAKPHAVRDRRPVARRVTRAGVRPQPMWQARTHTRPMAERWCRE